MPGCVLSLLILLGMMTPVNTPVDQSTVCADLEVYFTTAGEHIRSHLSRLIDDDAWVGSFENSIARANASAQGILGLGGEEIEPILDLVAVPGEALKEIPEDTVPPIAQGLHESALQYHEAMPAMLQATNKGGVYASVPFSEDIEEAGVANREAQRGIRDTCPSVIEQIESFQNTHDLIDLNNALTDPASLDPAVLDAMTPEANRALAFPMLFFMAGEQPEDAGTARHPDEPTISPDQTDRNEGQGDSNGIARIGDAAPDFEMQTFDGQTFRLSEHRGEVVIINFWGSWCPPCREEMPAFQQAWEESDDDVLFVGVGSKRDSEEEAKAFADDFGVTYPIGRDTEGGSAANGQVTEDYNILVYPTTYIIDPDGNISAIVMYAMNMDDLSGYIDQAKGR